MSKKLGYSVFVFVALLCLLSGTAAHNIFGLEIDKDSRACFEIGQHAICVTPLKQ
jgi:hypothetical protein